MKITYIHQYFRTPAQSGGTRSYEMARRMVAAGHTVNMVTADPGRSAKGGGWRAEDVDGITVHKLPNPYDNTMGNGRRLIAFGSFAMRSAAYASRLPADVVFATSTPLTVAVPGVFASWSRRVPMVFEVRDLWPELPIAMGALRSRPARIAARGLERWAYANAARIIALSPGMADGVARAGFSPARIHCIPNSCDTALFDVPAARGEAFRAARPWLGLRPLVVYAGTFGRINGVGYMAELAARMASIDAEVRFLAIGAGAEFESVRERGRALGVLDRNFFIEPPVPKERMPDVLSAATVCTSLFIPVKAMWHNSANKFFDALAAGRPVAINYGGWQSDLLATTGAGLTLEEAPSTESARRLAAFLKVPAELAAARRAAATLARSEFSRDRLAADLILTLERAVAEASPRRRGTT